MKKSARRRPELEPLESVLLLSTASHHARPAVPVPVTVTLAGTLSIRTHVTGQKLSANGSGDLAPVGRASLSYSGKEFTPSRSVTLDAPRGKLILVAAAPIDFAALPGAVHYRVIGGTGPYAGATGSGVATLTPTAAGAKATATLTFS